MTNRRIWELDTLRGICIIAMVVVHFIYNAVNFFGLFQWQLGPIFQTFMSWGGIAFVLLSGVCATLGTHSLRRGLIVFGCGMVITAATVAMYLLGIAKQSILIYFGVLHCLGTCMILWHFLKKCPIGVLILLSAAILSLSLSLQGITVSFPWLTPLGLTTATFESADYFPLLPDLGFFLLGAIIGQICYRNKQTLLPRVNTGRPLIRFCCACGRHSLAIYMLHQPIIALILLPFVK